MAGDFSEESSTSWFSRIGESIKSVLIGIVLFLVAFPLLGWNEYRAVTTYRSLSEGRKSLVTVDPKSVDSANNDKFVHMSGQATTDETLKDTTFGVTSPQTIRLVRSVEMYQWKENKETKTSKKLGGGKKTVTTYRYVKEWSSRPLDSSSFNSQGKASAEQETGEKIKNPPMSFESQTFTANKVTLGAFTLPKELVAEIEGSESLPYEKGRMSAEAPKLPEGFKVQGDGLYKGANPGSPAIGDVRVKFTITKAAVVSVYGQQNGDTLRPYQTRAGDALMDLRMGDMSAEAMIQAAEGENTTLTWILRLVGFIVMAVGIYMVFSPLVVVADVIPFVGDLLSVGAIIFAVLIALPLTLITIAIAWIVVRPLLGIGLLVAGGVIIVVAIYLGTRARAKPRAAAA